MPLDPLTAYCMLISKRIEFLPEVRIENWPDLPISEYPHPFVLTP
jgi:hypothetical protein